MKDIKESKRGEFNAQGKPQRDFIEDISERVAGYMGGSQFAVRDWEFNETELFNAQANDYVGEAEITLELRIEIYKGDKK